MDQSEARSGPSTQTKIQIWFEYSDMDPDLEAGSNLDQRRPGASWGTRKQIRSTPQWIWVDREEPGSTKWIGPRYNFPMLYIWNGSGTIKSSTRLNCLEAPDKDSTKLDCFKHSAGLDYFETEIRTRQGWTVLRPESIENIDESDDEDLV